MAKMLLIFMVVILISYLGQKYNHYIENNEIRDEHKLIQQYVLNENALYGYNKPKLWIHSKYEYNARKWQSFQSRSSTDLNQPWLHLTIKSIVLHNADDFNVCLIDDATFSKLIPKWTVDVSSLPEPKKSQYRELGLATLLYIYGGLIVPNSFICRRSLKPLYENGVSNKTPFVFENINRHVNTVAGPSNHFTLRDHPNDYLQGATALIDNAKRDLEIQKNNPVLRSDRQRLAYLPFPQFMGCAKNDPVIKDIVEFLSAKALNPHFSCESDILGDYPQFCVTLVAQGRMTLYSGEWIGVKTYNTKENILLDHLMGEDFLDIYPEAYGIYIPENEVLLRNKYQWLAYMNGDDLLKTNMIMSKYLIESTVNYIEPKYTLVEKTDVELVPEDAPKRTVLTI